MFSFLYIFCIKYCGYFISKQLFQTNNKYQITHDLFGTELVENGLGLLFRIVWAYAILHEMDELLNEDGIGLNTGGFEVIATGEIAK